MSDENEISWPLFERHLTKRGVVYQTIREALPHVQNGEIEELIKELESKAPINKEDMRKILKDLEKQRGDCFMRTQCRKIAKRLGL